LLSADSSDTQVSYRKKLWQNKSGMSPFATTFGITWPNVKIS
jgi:hypothetical protein